MFINKKIKFIFSKTHILWIFILFFKKLKKIKVVVFQFFFLIKINDLWWWGDSNPGMYPYQYFGSQDALFFYYF